MAKGKRVLGRSLDILFWCSGGTWGHGHVREAEGAGAVTRARAGRRILVQQHFRDGWRKRAQGRCHASSPGTGFTTGWKIKPVLQRSSSRSNLEVSEADICPGQDKV